MAASTQITSMRRDWDLVLGYLTSRGQDVARSLAGLAAEAEDLARAGVLRRDVAEVLTQIARVARNVPADFDEVDRSTKLLDEEFWRRLVHQREAGVEAWAAEGGAPGELADALALTAQSIVRSIEGSAAKVIPAEHKVAGYAEYGDVPLGESKRTAAPASVSTEFHLERHDPSALYPAETFWHGTPSGDLRGGAYGLHVGTWRAAHDALVARIGHPAKGHWDGTREYGKTMLAGSKTRLARGLVSTGLSASGPEEDHYPNGRAVYSDETPVALDSKPDILPVRITGEMTNAPDRPHEDFKANGYMRAQVTKGHARRGYYYTNVGEDEGSISAVVPPGGGHLEMLPKVHRHSPSGEPVRITHQAAARATNPHVAADHPISWDQIAERHPDTYAVEHDEEAGDSGPGEEIAQAAGELAFDRPEEPSEEAWHHASDLDWRHEMVDPRHVDYARHGLSDGRVRHAYEGFKAGAEVPPAVLVHRHGVYQVADGHHRAEAAHHAGVMLPAYVAHSPHPDTPFSAHDGNPSARGPFNGAEPIRRHAAVEAGAEPPVVAYKPYERGPVGGTWQDEERANGQHVTKAGFAGFVHDSEYLDDIKDSDGEDESDEFDEDLHDETSPEPTAEERAHYEEHDDYPESYHDRHDRAYEHALEQRRRERQPDIEDRHLIHFVSEHNGEPDLWRRHGHFGPVNLTQPIYATQSHVSRAHVQRYVDHPSDTSHHVKQHGPRGGDDEYLAEEAPLFVTHEGRLHATEGHHRIAAALARGEKSIHAWHYDMDRHPVPGCETCRDLDGLDEHEVTEQHHHATVGAPAARHEPVSEATTPTEVRAQAAAPNYESPVVPEDWDRFRGHHLGTDEAGVSYHYYPAEDGRYPVVKARVGDHPGAEDLTNVADLTWFDHDGPAAVKNAVQMVEVHPDFRRRGIASRLWEHARAINPDLVHSPTDQLPEGAEWATAVDAKTAGYADLPEHDEESARRYRGGDPDFPMHRPGDRWSNPNAPVDWVAVDKLLPYRQHAGDLHDKSERNVEALAHDLRSGKGLISPVLLGYDPDRHEMTISNGNHELESARRAGWTHVPAVVLRSHEGSDHSMVPAGFDRPALPEGKWSFHPHEVLPKHWVMSERKEAATEAGLDDMGRHRPMRAAPVHDLTAGESGVPDVYDHPEYYGDTAEPGYRQTLRELRRLRGNPGATVTVHRAAPAGGFRTGDWVALSPQYAKSMGVHPTDPAKDLPVHSAEVPAEHVHWAGADHLQEFGYWGPPIAAVGDRAEHHAVVDEAGHRLFHLAPRDARDSIAQHGLDWRRAPGAEKPRDPRDLAPAGIYFHRDRAAAEDMASEGLAQTHDLYEVDARGLDLSPDPYQPDDAVLTRDPVPTSRIKLVRPADGGATEHRAAAERDHRVQHQPVNSIPLHDLDHTHDGQDSYSGGGFYAHADEYRDGGPHDAESMGAIWRAKGRPKAKVKVYRAAPHGVSGINSGDWISLSRSYAREHAHDLLGPGQHGRVYQATVPAEHVGWDGNSVNEFGYFGPDIKAPKRKPPPQHHFVHMPPYTPDGREVLAGEHALTAYTRETKEGGGDYVGHATYRVDSDRRKVHVLESHGEHGTVLNEIERRHPDHTIYSAIPGAASRTGALAPGNTIGDPTKHSWVQGFTDGGEFAGNVEVHRDPEAPDRLHLGQVRGYDPAKKLLVDRPSPEQHQRLREALVAMHPGKRVTWAGQRTEHPEFREPMPGDSPKLPEGLDYHLELGQRPSERVLHATREGKPVGHLHWTTGPGGAVEMVKVQPEHQRRGVATALWDRARRLDPDIQHSPVQTPDGSDWAAHERARRQGTKGGDSTSQHIPIERARQEGDITWRGTAGPGSPLVYRSVGDVAELHDAFQHGRWASHGEFTNHQVEGGTQFTPDREEAMRWAHPLRHSRGHPVTVEADITGLPVGFIGMSSNWEHDGKDSGKFHADTSAGVGVDGGLPVGRIRRAWTHDGRELDADGLREHVRHEMAEREPEDYWGDDEGRHEAAAEPAQPAGSVAQDVYDREEDGRRAMKLPALSRRDAGELFQRVMTDHGYGEDVAGEPEHLIRPHPSPRESAPGSDLLGGLHLSLGRDMHDELTVLHETAHLIAERGRPTRPLAPDDPERPARTDHAHRPEWQATYRDLVRRYASPATAEHFDQAFHPDHVPNAVVRRENLRKRLEREQPRRQAAGSHPPAAAEPERSVERHRATATKARELARELDSQGEHSESPLRSVIENARHKGSHLAIARSDGRLVGAVGFNVDRTLRQLEVHDMRVMDKGQGHGRALLQEVARHAADLPHGEQYAMRVYNAVGRAIPFYERVGAEFANRPFSSIGEWSPDRVRELARREAARQESAEPPFRIVWHTTRDEHARVLRERGTAGRKPIGPRTVDSDYEPGRGPGTGIYLAERPDPVYGDLAIPVKVYDHELAVSPERRRRIPHGMTPQKSLQVGDGYTEAHLPADRFGEPRPVDWDTVGEVSRSVRPEEFAPRAEPESSRQAAVEASAGRPAPLEGQASKTASRLSRTFEHAEEEAGGTKWPTRRTITVRTPDGEQAGYLRYLSNPRGTKLLVDTLQVHEGHQRRGHAAALMDELHRRHPDAAVDHGDRTDNAGKGWWDKYRAGRPVRRGRVQGAGDEPDRGYEVQALTKPAAPSFTWRYQTQTSTGYEDRERVVEGPFYHGSRSKRLREGDTVRPGFKTNAWGDEGERSSHVHFTTDLAGAGQYAEQAGGHVYEVEPTGEAHGGYNGMEFKSRHPLRVLRRVSPEEWSAGPREAAVAEPVVVVAAEPPARRVLNQDIDWPHELGKMKGGVTQAPDTPEPSEPVVAPQRTAAYWGDDYRLGFVPQHLRRFLPGLSEGEREATFRKHAPAEGAWRDDPRLQQIKPDHRRAMEDLPEAGRWAMLRTVGPHPGAAPPEEPKEQDPTARATFFHGTVHPFRPGSVVRPAAEHGRGVTFASDTDPGHAYATADHDDAWTYAEKAHDWYNTRRRHGQPTRIPRVYEVEPVRRDSVGLDPQGRGNNPGDVRSPHGFRVLREVPMPERMGSPKDWRR